MAKVRNRVGVIFCLVFAGEMIFSLPFHIARFFRPTVLEVFSVSNSALGDIFAIYGVIAMLAYFPGGMLADRFSTRKLISIALVATALGGLYMATIPGIYGLTLLFAYWGLTSILLFWAALIRATRQWGGQHRQGIAFGLLDGGRGLAAAAFASLGVILFGLFIPSGMDQLNAQQRIHALQAVIYYYSLITLIAAGAAWWILPASNRDTCASSATGLCSPSEVTKMPRVWLQAIVVICAYCGYKGLDYYGLYAFEVLQMSELDSARLTSAGAYLRPVAAIFTGWIVDRFTPSKVILLIFTFLFLGYISLAWTTPERMSELFIIGNLIFTALAVFGVRGVYFALLEESKISQHMTGTAVGLISVIGFTPDIFFAPVAGRILDSAPGAQGYVLFFTFLTGIAAIGIISTVYLLQQSAGKSATTRL